MKLFCPTCLREPVLVNGVVIYPSWPNLHSLKFWLCARCDAYVGCHAEGARVEQRDGSYIRSDGTLPLGRLANPALRKAKREAHAAFDPLWKEGSMDRRQAYAWLANEMKLDRFDCHIGLFNCQQCRQVVEIVRAYRHRAVAAQRSLL